MIFQGSRISTFYHIMIWRWMENKNNDFCFDKIYKINKFSDTEINVFSKYVTSKKMPSQW